MEPLSGNKFKALRRKLGFSAAEFAHYLASVDAPIQTDRSVFRLETTCTVSARYVDALRQLAGIDAFESALAEVVAIAAGSRSIPSRVSSPRKRKRDRVGIGQSDPDRFLRLMNSLPMQSRIDDWLGLFREVLREFFGDVDRVTVNVNHTFRLNAVTQSGTEMIATEHKVIGSEGSIVRVTLERDEDAPADRLLREFRSNGYCIDEYQAPVSQDYFVGGAYLGTIFLWRSRSQRGISNETVELFRSLEPFMLFALTDIVARNHHAKPFDEAFDDALANLLREAHLTDQEGRVVVLLLLGHKYRQIAERLNISIDAVRKHTQSIYRKTGTKGSAQLFAKYFTFRLRA